MFEWLLLFPPITITSVFISYSNCSYYNSRWSTYQLSYLCTLKTWHYPPHLLLRVMLLRCKPCSNWSISSTRWAHSSKPTAATYSGQMGQTDRHLTVSYTASHTVPAAPIIEILRHRHVTITQNINKWADDCNCKPVHLHWEQFVTRSSAIAEGPRDAPWQ